MSKTVVVLGASYGGSRAATILCDRLPPDWTLYVIERNTLLNRKFLDQIVLTKDVYVFPRCAVLFEYAPRAFIPYDNVFKSERTEGCNSFLIQATVTGLHEHSVVFRRHKSDGEEEISFDYAVYALGSGMPRPVNIWTPTDDHLAECDGSKSHGIKWLARQAKVFGAARDVLVIGGGALGIQFATDLKERYPAKSITLLHSRKRLLPSYPHVVHHMCIERMKHLGIQVVLGQRVVTWPEEGCSRQVVRTDTGMVYEADILLCCTGQQPETAIIKALCPSCINSPTRRIAVLPTMQVESQSDVDLRHIFAIGDCADTGAIQAGNTAYWQAEVAAANIVKLTHHNNDMNLQQYLVGKPMIKLSLGLTKSLYAHGDVVEVNEDGPEDLGALSMWGLLRASSLPVDA